MRKPWWPNYQLPDDAVKTVSVPNVPEGSTGRLRFDATNVFALTPGDSPVSLPLCKATFSVPTACVLELSVANGAGTMEGGLGQRLVDFAAGQDGAITGSDVANALGFAVITYGAGQTQNRIVMDLRSGSYQLPPCTQVDVFVSSYFYTMDAGPFAPSSLIAGAIVPGSTQQPAVPTYTVPIELAAAVAGEIVIPDGARLVDCWVRATGGTVFGVGAGVVDLYPNGSTSLMPTVHRDFEVGSYTPPYPASVLGVHRSNLGILSTVDGVGVVQFELEF